MIRAWPKMRFDPPVGVVHTVQPRAVDRRPWNSLATPPADGQVVELKIQRLMLAPRDITLQRQIWSWHYAIVIVVGVWNQATTTFLVEDHESGAVLGWRA